METERLLMRPHRLDDVGFIVQLNSDLEVTKYVGGAKITAEQAIQRVVSLAQQFKEKRMGRFIVVEKQNKEIIGWCGLKWLPERNVVDLGYRFLKNAWGKGFATEAATESLRYGFINLDLDVIFAGAHPKNSASIHVLKKLGLKEIGRRIEDSDEYIDFNISKTEFIASCLRAR